MPSAPTMRPAAGRIPLFSTSSLLIAALLHPHWSGASAADLVPYATVHVVTADDNAAAIAAKAAKVLPRPVQTDWMRLERTFFLHFGVNTFNQVEWGNGREQPSLFNPSALDATQWLRTVKQFDGKMLVLVANPRLLELDLNPVILGPKGHGLLALDALMLVG